MKKILMTFFPLFLLLASLAASPLPAVRGGRAAAEIVLPEKALPGEAWAADELAYWLKRITGAELPVVKKSGMTNGKPHIYIGGSFAESKFAGDMDKLRGNDGLGIRFDGDDVYLFGGRPRGTLFAVYRLIEDNSDLIWARPEPKFGTVFSPRKEFVMQRTNVLDVPTFVLRAWNVCSLRWHGPTGLWIMRNGGNYGDQISLPETDMLTCFGGGHGLFNVVPKDKYMKTNPEFFALSAQSNSRVNAQNFCLTNKDLPQVFADNLEKIIAAMPRAPEFVWIGMNDTWEVCDCAECRKPIALPDGKILTMKDPRAGVDPEFRSTQYYMFLNRMIAHFAPRRSDVAFITFAYIYSAAVPAVKIDPRIGVMFAPYPTRNDRYPLIDPRQSNVWRERFEKFSAMTKNLGFYEYYGPSTRMTSLTARDDLRELRKRGGRIGVKAECGPDYPLPGEGADFPLSEQWDMLPMEYYLITKLMWNPDQDYDALCDKFLKRAYRESADDMREFYDLYRSQWLNPAKKTLFSHCHSGDLNLFRELVVNGKIEDKCRAALRRALDKARHPASRELIAATLRRFDQLSAGLKRLQVESAAAPADGMIKFADPVWEKVPVLTDFRRPRRYLTSQVKPEGISTELRMLSAGGNIYFRVNCTGAVMPKKTAAAGKEKIPSGDRVAIVSSWHRFYIGADGSLYDDKMGNFNWNAGGQLDFQPRGDGYGFVLRVPLAAIGVKPGATPPLNVDRFDAADDFTSLGGLVCGRYNFDLFFADTKQQKDVVKK